MDVNTVAKLASSVAETGIKQDVGLAVLKRAQEIESSTASQLISAVQAPQSLPAHLGNTINTTA